MSRIVWDAENGWHDGPECHVLLDVNGAIRIKRKESHEHED